jgi:sec-independent protein translocase protein TatC
MGDSEKKDTKATAAKKKKKQHTLGSTMSLGDHLEELRTRLFLALGGMLVVVVICLIPFFFKYIRTLIYYPHDKVMPELSLIVLAPADPFIVYMKISLIAGLILSSPWVFYQLWMFVAAGLYTREKQYVHLAVPFSAALFVTGALFFLFLVAPISLRFFLKFGKFIDVTPSWTLQKYVSFITMLMLVFGVGFQTPVAIFFLNRTGLVSIQALRRSRKYVLLLIVILAAIATPPDVVSQITLAVPLYLLFELGILLSYVANRKKTSQ